LDLSCFCGNRRIRVVLSATSFPLVEALLRLPVVEQQAARRRHEAMQGIDRGDEHSSRLAVQREEQLLGELLDLLSTNKLSLARKVMGSQAFMRARGRKLRNQEDRDDL
jgi:hypothetical protein